MRIDAIRLVIDAAQWANLDLQGHTREEFARRNVPAVMTPHIEALDALEIAPRFVYDVDRRANVRANCERQIARWNELQVVPADLNKIARVAHYLANEGRDTNWLALQIVCNAYNENKTAGEKLVPRVLAVY